jgi:hypothetical protein
MPINFNNQSMKVFRGIKEISKIYKGQSLVYQLMLAMTSGEIAYTTPGTYTWVAPEGVTSVSVVAIGGGGGSGAYNSRTGGAGGGLGWKNNITVVPGQLYTVVVGDGGETNGGGNAFPGQASYFINTSTVAGFGGTGGAVSTNFTTMSGGSYVGDGGGVGGNSLNPGLGDAGGGGGAGGYTASGGTGSDSPTAGQGGAGGGGLSSRTEFGAGWGGGVGIYGKGINGAAGTSISVFGKSGSGGTRTNPNSITSNFEYGGGAPGPSQKGANGAIRIIWGEGRSFPNNAEEQYFFDIYDDELSFNNSLSNVLAGTDGTYAHVYSTNGLNLKVRRLNSSKQSTSLNTVYTASTTISKILSTMFSNGAILIAIVEGSSVSLITINSSDAIVNNYLAENGTSFSIGNISHNRVTDEVLVSLFKPTSPYDVKAWKTTNVGGYELISSVVNKRELSISRPGLVAWAGNDRVQFYSVGPTSIRGDTWDITNSVWVAQDVFVAGASFELIQPKIKVFSRISTQEAFFVFNSNDGFVNVFRTSYTGTLDGSRLFTEFGQNSPIQFLDANIDQNNQLGTVLLNPTNGIVYYQKYDLTNFEFEYSPIEFKYISNDKAWNYANSIDIDNPYGKMPFAVRDSTSSINRLMFLEIQN